MKKIVFPLLSVIIIAGCSSSPSDSELALQCAKLHEVKSLNNSLMYNIDTFADSDDLFRKERVYYDNVYGGCVYKMSWTEMLTNPEDGTLDMYRVEEFYDLEKDLYIHGYSGFHDGTPEYTLRKEELFELVN